MLLTDEQVDGAPNGDFSERPDGLLHSTAIASATVTAAVHVIAVIWRMGCI